MTRRPAAGARLAASALPRDLVRRHQRRRRAAAARSSSSIVSSQNELHAQFGGVVPEVASRRHTELRQRRSSPRRMSAAGVRLGRPRRRRHDAGPGPHRRAAGRAGGGQGHRLPPPPAADPGQPPPGAHRRQLRPRRGGAVRLPRGQRRAHAAGRGRGGRRVPRRGADAWTTPPARPSTRAPACSGSATRAARSWTGWPPRGDAGFVRFPARRAARPRLQLQRPQDGPALRPARPRRGGGRGAPRRHRRLVPGGDRRASWSTRPWRCAAGEGLRRVAIAGGVAANSGLRARARGALRRPRACSSRCRRSACAPTTPA